LYLESNRKSLSVLSFAGCLLHFLWISRMPPFSAVDNERLSSHLSFPHLTMSINHSSYLHPLFFNSLHFIPIVVRLYTTLPSVKTIMSSSYLLPSQDTFFVPFRLLKVLSLFTHNLTYNTKRTPFSNPNPFLYSKLWDPKPYNPLHPTKRPYTFHLPPTSPMWAG
jgi:hypothetical protein